MRGRGRPRIHPAFTHRGHHVTRLTDTEMGMKELILSLLAFHWLGTLTTGIALVVDALRRPLRRTVGWIFPVQPIGTLAESIQEPQKMPAERSYSRAA